MAGFCVHFVRTVDPVDNILIGASQFVADPLVRRAVIQEEKATEEDGDLQTRMRTETETKTRTKTDSIARTRKRSVCM